MPRPLLPIFRRLRESVPMCHSSRLIVFFSFVLSVSFSAADSRTWYVRSDGSGDAICIRAAVDSSSAGDSVVVAAGTYTESILLDKGIVLVSEEGAFATRITPPPGEIALFAVKGVGLGSHRTEIKGFWIEGFDADGSCAIRMEGGRRTEIQYNVITGNRVGVSLHNGSAFLRHNTFYGNDACAVDATSMGSGICECNVVWDRAAGFDRVIAFYNDFMNLLDAGAANPDNFSQHPEFCGAAAGNLFLQSDSPCAPGNSPWPEAGLIGALPVGCDEVKTENLTWGSIKRIYLEPE